MKNLLGRKGICAVGMSLHSWPNAAEGKEFFLPLGMQALARD
jgi:hypothetical protein